MTGSPRRGILRSPAGWGRARGTACLGRQVTTGSRSPPSLIQRIANPLARASCAERGLRGHCQLCSREAWPDCAAAFSSVRGMLLHKPSGLALLLVLSEQALDSVNVRTLVAAAAPKGRGLQHCAASRSRSARRPQQCNSAVHHDVLGLVLPRPTRVAAAIAEHSQACGVARAQGCAPVGKLALGQVPCRAGDTKPNVQPLPPLGQKRRPCTHATSAASTNASWRSSAASGHLGSAVSGRAIEREAQRAGKGESSPRARTPFPHSPPRCPVPPPSQTHAQTPASGAARAPRNQRSQGPHQHRFKSVSGSRRTSGLPR